MNKKKIVHQLRISELAKHRPTSWRYSLILFPVSIRISCSFTVLAIRKIDVPLLRVGWWTCDREEGGGRRDLPTPALFLSTKAEGLTDSLNDGLGIVTTSQTIVELVSAV